MCVRADQIITRSIKGKLYTWYHASQDISKFDMYELALVKIHAETANAERQENLFLKLLFQD